MAPKACVAAVHRRIVSLYLLVLNLFPGCICDSEAFHLTAEIESAWERSRRINVSRAPRAVVRSHFIFSLHAHIRHLYFD